MAGINQGTPNKDEFMLPISMNLRGERNNMIKSLTLSIGLALALATPASAAIEWTFNASKTDLAGTGSGIATVALGDYGKGWQDGVTRPFINYGTATGFWDLGKAGSIALTGMTGSGLTTIQVFQWVDAGTYSGALTYDVGGHSPLSITSSLVQSTSHGAWCEYDATFASSLLSTDTVTIRAPDGGAIIDRLAVVPEPATMIAGAVLLIPFLLSTFRVLRRKKTA